MSDTRSKGSDGEMRHGDSAVAGLLAWAATHAEVAPAAGVTVEDEDLNDGAEGLFGFGHNSGAIFGPLDHGDLS